MNLPNYPIETNNSYTVFTFTSDGPKGEMIKAVVFSLISEDRYNLALGDVNPKTGFLDDLSRTNNSDVEKVLSTVAHCILKFMSVYPDKSISVKGNSKSRNRLYRLSINKYLNASENKFTIYGFLNDQKFSLEDYPELEYDRFLIEPKKD